MQKLWSSKSKRSQPLPPEEKSMEHAVAQSGEASEITEKDTNDSKLIVNPQIVGYLQTFWKYIPEPIKNLNWQKYSNWLLFLLGVGGISLVANWGLRHLTAPESTPTSTLVCKSKISGDWETPFGKVTLQEKGNDDVVGEYAYSNFERGKVNGKFTGKQDNNIISFAWQENQSQPDQQQGHGVLIFGEGCTEFYGSYGTGDSNNNFGSWRGYRLSK
ncbi:MAG: hypothetical protein AUK48_00250 [Oscillatoriales cyanobacterium CG2_30_44_21]|nr:MAG: hypothetical protein AUK48_00250 [Oscillatoriales cyanobacterium CG2_30_44_21]